MNVDLSILSQYGILGIVLSWFMWRMEKKLDGIATVISDFTVASLLETLSRDRLSDHLKDQAMTILSRVSRKAHDDFVARHSQGIAPGGSVQ